MKELSIEEKAKRYDKASKWMEGIYPTLTHEQQMEAEAFFPELKESEDKRIRKALIELVHDTTGDSLWVDYNVHKEDALAWLEKQGEHANFRNKIQIGDKVTRNEAGILVNISQLNRVAKPAKRQGGQKLADKVEPKFKIKYAGREYNVLEVKDIAGVTFYGIEDEPNHIDYVKAENCERVCGYNIKEKSSPYPTKPAVFSEQNPAWSEEDEKMLGLSVENLTELKDRFGKEYGRTGDCIDWLKFLKAKCTWKPSKEQMEFLLKYAEQNNYDGSILTSLYQDLKKLKG